MSVVFSDVIDTAPSRTGDPVESLEAGAMVNVTAQQRIVLSILASSKTGLTDEMVYRETVKRGLYASPSGLRTRRKALMDAGYVERRGSAVSPSGRACGVFGLTVKGRGVYDLLAVAA